MADSLDSNSINETLVPRHYVPDARRSYVKKEKFEPFKEFIIAQHQLGQTHAEILSSLAEQGLRIEEGDGHRLKRVLRIWQVSRQYNRRGGNPTSRDINGPNLPVNEEAEPHITEPQTQNFDPLDFAFAFPSGNAPELLYWSDDLELLNWADDELVRNLDTQDRIIDGATSSSNTMKPLSSYIGLSGLLGGAGDTSLSTPPNLQSLDYIELQTYYKPYLEEHLRRRRLTAKHVKNEINKEIEKGADEDTAYLMLQQRWNYKAWKKESKDAELSVLPPWVYDTFGPENEKPGRHDYNDEESEESQKLERVFKENFAILRDFGVAHYSDSESGLGWDIRSVAVHILEIERRFGPTHIFLIEAINVLGGMLNQIEDSNYEAVITLSHLELNKLRRLGRGLEEGYNAMHACQHMRRALDVAGNFSEALKYEKEYYLLRERREKVTGVKTGAFPLTLMIVTSVESTCKEGNYYAATNLLDRWLSLLSGPRAYAATGQFSESHGHTSAGYDCRTIGAMCQRIEYHEGAVRSFELAIVHFSECVYKEKLYQTMRDCARVYALLRKYEAALVYFQKHFNYRRKAYGINDVSARASLDAIKHIITENEGVYPFIPSTLSEMKALVGQGGISLSSNS